MQEDILDDHFNKGKDKSPLTNRPIIIWVIVLGIGLLFRFMRWPGSAVLIILSTAGLQAFSLNGLIKPDKRNSINTVFSILGFMWLITLIGGILFNNGHPYNIAGLEMYFIVFIPYFVIYYLIITWRTKRKKAKTQSKISR